MLGPDGEIAEDVGEPEERAEVDGACSDSPSRRALALRLERGAAVIALGATRLFIQQLTQPLIELGQLVRQALDAGVVAGYPVKDVRVIVYDGKSHSVDSKDIAFATAGRKAFIDAVLKARPIVLEPIVKVEISAPEHAMGDITGDLSAKRGQVSGTQSLTGGSIVVNGQVPLSELNGYQARLNGMTGGQGRYTLELSHYEPVPPTLQAQLASQYKLKDDE